MFLLVSLAHQSLNSMSDLSTVTEYLTVACQRRWYGLPAVQEAAMLCQKTLRRIFLLAVLGLSLGGCEPYYDEGGSYYSSEVYTSPAPTHYAGGSSYYSNGYYTPPPRYYMPPARYYQPTPRYYSQPRMYQPHYYQPAPRYYQQPYRGDYRMHQNHGWDGRNHKGWNNDFRGHDGRDHRDGRGDHNWRGNHR
jgi:hypothetical protein